MALQMAALADARRRGQLFTRVNVERKPILSNNHMRYHPKRPSLARCHPVAGFSALRINILKTMGNSTFNGEHATFFFALVRLIDPRCIIRPL